MNRSSKRPTQSNTTGPWLQPLLYVKYTDVIPLHHHYTYTSLYIKIILIVKKTKDTLTTLSTCNITTGYAPDMNVNCTLIMSTWGLITVLLNV